MHNLRSFLLQNSWCDEDGNTIAFFTENLQKESALPEQIWLFLDEGGCCGGRQICIACEVDAVNGILEGCGQMRLKELFLTSICENGY